MISTMLEIAATAIDIVFLVYFVSGFQKTKPFEHIRTLIFPTVLLGMQLVLDTYFADFTVLYISCVFVLSGAYAIFIHPQKWLRGLAAACLYLMILILGSSLVFNLLSLFVKELETLLYGADTPARTIYIILGKTIQFFLFRLTLILFQENRMMNRRSEWSVLIFNGATIVALVSLTKIMLENQGGVWRTPLIWVFLILLFLNGTFSFVLKQVQTLLKEKYEYQLIAERLESEKQRLNEAQNVWDEMRKLRHDMKNHLIALSGHLEKGETEQAIDYIERFTDRIEEQNVLVYFGHPIIDYLLHTKLSLLRDVDLHLVGSASNLPQMEDLDLVCIVGNLLDNAMEALKKVSEDRKLTFSILRVEQNCLITVKNTITSSVLGSNPDLKTTKSSPLFHGLGHRIVKETVDKYGGHIAYSEADGMFCVQILLPLPLHE